MGCFNEDRKPSPCFDTGNEDESTPGLYPASDVYEATSTFWPQSAEMETKDEQDGSCEPDMSDGEVNQILKLEGIDELTEEGIIASIMNG